MTKTFQTADVCDEAHIQTVAYCKRLGIALNLPEDEWEDEEEPIYSEEAKRIFDSFVVKIEEKWESEGMVNERDL